MIGFAEEVETLKDIVSSNFSCRLTKTKTITYEAMSLCQKKKSYSFHFGVSSDKGFFSAKFSQIAFSKIKVLGTLTSIYITNIIKL